MLLLVDSTGERAVDASTIAPHLQAALDAWELLQPDFRALSERLEADPTHGAPLDPRHLCAPLPRAYEWIDASSFLNTALVATRRIRASEALSPSARVSRVPAYCSADRRLGAAGAAGGSISQPRICCSRECRSDARVRAEAICGVPLANAPYRNLVSLVEDWVGFSVEAGHCLRALRHHSGRARWRVPRRRVWSASVRSTRRADRHVDAGRGSTFRLDLIDT